MAKYNRSSVLGILLAAMVATSLHSVAAQPVLKAHWELYAFADIDGVRAAQERVSAENFATVSDCIKAAIALPAPPDSRTTASGHTIVYGYTCHRVDPTGIST